MFRSLPVLGAIVLALVAGFTPGPRAEPEPRSMAPDFLIIAHRGASGHAPEHTIAAYDRAVAMGADVLEPDLQMTADGILVAFHDATLDRTARGPDGACTGRIRERTFEELQQCDVGSWFNERYPDRADPDFAGLRIPALEALFERYGASVHWYPETKSPDEAPGMEEALLELLVRHELRDPAVERGLVLIQSFSPESLERMKALDPELPLVQLLPRDAVTPDTLDETLDRIARYAAGVGPSRFLVDSAFMASARARGLFVHPWTVNEVPEMDRLLALGVDGIFSDFPDRLRERVEAASADGGATTPPF